jgi:acetyl esterase/lipase
MPAAAGPPLTVDSRIADVLSDPAFAGFSPLLLPWDGRSYDDRLTLRDVGTLMPYHSHVDPVLVVDALNHMRDEVRAGRQVFHRFYTDAEMQADPTKAHTGLFFFRGRPGAPFAVVCPGGGFAYVGSLHEGFPYACEISGAGYNAFVLRYRAGHGGGVATEDLAAAISYVFQHSSGLGVGLAGYSLWGSSAGARMAAAVGSNGVAAYGGADLPKPAAVVMAYTGLSGNVGGDPPTFVVVGDQDMIAPPQVMERRIAELRRAGTPVEYHRFPGVGHGFGPGTGTSAGGWILDALRFWERYLPDEGT